MIIINILNIKNLSKSYYTKEGEIKAINNISLNIKKGEFLCIVGPSGCGKSTLLNILAKLDNYCTGKIEYDTSNIISYMPQTDALFPWLNILDNTLLGLRITKRFNNNSINLAIELLNKYGLKDFIYKYPKELSGGMRQRVALIRTILLNPTIILLDEPFSALDYQTRLSVSNDIYNIIKERKITAIMVTHDIAEAISLSDRIAILSQRPSIIKKIITIDLPKTIIPIKRRNEEVFKDYYDSIWKELDI